jgi:hypothetical protein
LRVPVDATHESPATDGRVRSSIVIPQAVAEVEGHLVAEVELPADEEDP